MLQEKIFKIFLPGNDVGEDNLSESVCRRFKNRIFDILLDRSIALFRSVRNDRGDVPGWVLVVLMTTGLVTGIWTLAAPRIDSILRNSLDSMNGIR